MFRSSDNVDKELARFRVGQLVRLLGHRNPVVVEAVVSPAERSAALGADKDVQWGVHCAWIGAWGEPHRAVFSPQTLEAHTSPETEDAQLQQGD